MILFFIALAAFAATMLGGYFALKLRDRLHLILGFSAGAVLGVAFFAVAYYKASEKPSVTEYCLAQKICIIFQENKLANFFFLLLYFKLSRC